MALEAKDRKLNNFFTGPVPWSDPVIRASVLGGTPYSLNDLSRVPGDVAWAAVTCRFAITRSQTDRETTV